MDPCDTINWGQPLQAGPCGDARNQALASAPYGFDDTPGQLMEAVGWAGQTEFNADATVGRLIGALLYLVVAAAALALFVVTTFTLVVESGRNVADGARSSRSAQTQHETMQPNAISDRPPVHGPSATVGNHGGSARNTMSSRSR